MQNKPLVFFIALMTLALMLILTYQIKMNPTNIFTAQQQAPTENQHEQEQAIGLFAQHCANCHGSFGEGRGTNPAIKGTRLAHDQIATRIRTGKGAMPAFPQLTEQQVHLLVSLVEKM